MLSKNTKFPMLIIWKRKHNTVYYLINSKEDYDEALYRMFKSMDLSKWYHFAEPYDKEATTLIETTPEIENNQALRAAAKTHNNRVKRFIAYNKDLEYQRDLYEKAVAGDKAAAVELVEFRRDYEYEEFIEESLECVS